MITLTLTEEEVNTIAGLLTALKEQSLMQTGLFPDPMNVINQVATKQYKIAESIIYQIARKQDENG